MNKEQTKARIKKLRELIERYRYEYHVHDKSLVSDAVNDSLKNELLVLETQYPDLITPDSPTQRVGGEALKEFKEVRHRKPMLSLNDSFAIEDIKEWEKRLKKLEPTWQWGYYVEMKIDGLAISLVYEGGIFIQGATRGNGIVGEDVTQNLKTIEAIPLKLRESLSASGRIEVRGELFLPKKEFAKLNKEREKAGLSLYANPRNIAAGSVRQLDPKITAARNLSFMAWELIISPIPKTHEESHKILQKLGFKINPNNRPCRDLAEVEQYINYWEEKRKNLPYQTDGLVIGVNSEAKRAGFGVVGKAPRGAIAYKFVAEEATTIVDNIIVQVGRTGTLTPVAKFKPTLVAGTTVSRATLHNADEIAKKDVRMGDTVVIHKAGDIIPEVVRVIKELRPAHTKEFYMPRHCPICKQSIIRLPGKAAYRCTNKNCFAQNLRALQHFAGKNGMDIEGLGPKILEQLINEGLIKGPADLFELKKGDLEPLERFAEKSAANIVLSVEAHKKVSLWRFLNALGIRHVGEETARDLARSIEEEIKPLKEYAPDKLIKEVSGWPAEKWATIRDVGGVVAESIAQFFGDILIQQLFKEFANAGVEIIRENGEHKNVNNVTGKTFIFTGEMRSLTRDEAKEKVRILGGEPSESVSKKTDYVVTGTDPGSKLDKAHALGVRVLSEKEFLKLIK